MQLKHHYTPHHTRHNLLQNKRLRQNKRRNQARFTLKLAAHLVDKFLRNHITNTSITWEQEWN